MRCQPLYFFNQSKGFHYWFNVLSNFQHMITDDVSFFHHCFQGLRWLLSLTCRHCGPPGLEVNLQAQRPLQDWS
uniref:Uncharacterized protein n=1 Tax=Anguilla anguilla TaxID=7936 RepID=A0A0E9WNK9_ANGAN